MGKATKKQMLDREEDIQAELRLGKDIHQFAEDLARKHKCSKGSIERQYQSMINSMAESQQEKREELRIKMQLRTDYLYNAALSAGNIKNAIDAVNLQAKIGGLYQPEKEKEKEKIQPPTFQFRQRDEAVPLQVVPKDDDDERNTGNS